MKKKETILRGIPASPGITIGKVFLFGKERNIEYVRLDQVLKKMRPERKFRHGAVGSKSDLAQNRHIIDLRERRRDPQRRRRRPPSARA